MTFLIYLVKDAGFYWDEKVTQSWSRCRGSSSLLLVELLVSGRVDPVPWCCPHGVGSFPSWGAQVWLSPRLFYTHGLNHHPRSIHTKIDALKWKEVFAQQIRLFWFLSQTRPLQGHCFVSGEEADSEASCPWAASLFLAFQDLRKRSLQ